MSAMLELRCLTRRFAGLLAVDKVDMAVRHGDIHAVIGPNGAGKTTLFNLVSGLVTPSEGEIYFAGTEISSRPPHMRTALGLARTFQNIRVFSSMSVRENVLTGGHTTMRATLAGVIALSFTDYQLGAPSFSWIGLSNYQEMFADRVFWISLRNTLT